MSRPELTPGQRHQLETLKPGMAQQLLLLLALGATTEEGAVDKRSCAFGPGNAHSSDLDTALVSRLALHRGLAASREVRAQYGIPKRRLYWLTTEGLAVATALREAAS